MRREAQVAGARAEPVDGLEHAGQTGPGVVATHADHLEVGHAAQRGASATARALASGAVHVPHRRDPRAQQLSRLPLGALRHVAGRLPRRSDAQQPPGEVARGGQRRVAAQVEVAVGVDQTRHQHRVDAGGTTRFERHRPSGLHGPGGGGDAPAVGQQRGADLQSESAPGTQNGRFS